MKRKPFESSETNEKRIRLKESPKSLKRKHNAPTEDTKRTRSTTASQLVFQHTATARHRAEDGTIEIMLYGRKANGTSVALRVSGARAYGFLGKVSVNSTFRGNVNKLVQWYLSIQRSERSNTRFKEEHNEDKPPQKIYRAWSSFFFPQSEVKDIYWSRFSGFNIRNVKDSEPPIVWKFSTRRYDVWRALLSILNDHKKVHKKIEDFYRKMKPFYMCCLDSGRPTKQMPSLPSFVEPFMVRSELYETMFHPEWVWMIDYQLPACSWMSVSDFAPVQKQKTFCAVEYTCRSDKVSPIENPPIPMAPIRVLSYDIEAVPFINETTGECEFPDPNRDIISTIGVTAFDMVSAVFQQVVFMLEIVGQPQCERLDALSEDKQTDEYDPSSTVVFSFLDEMEMLKAFSAYIREYDPEIITGYNVLNFDNVYLINRIRALCGCVDKKYCDKCANARTFSRIARATSLKKKYTHTNQRGGQETWEASIEGRDWMDLYNVVRTDHKLRSYKLDNVCLELMGTQKIHIDYEDIPKHQKTPAGRAFLAQYCVKDAWLPCQLIIKRCKLVNAIQMAQVTGVQLSDILHRGQQIRTMVLMLRFIKARCRRDKTHPRWYLPDESNVNGTVIDGFEGAVVIRPLPGFYQTPVVTLDFASLYPSIMRAYNMCFSTLISSYSLSQRLKLKWTPETHNIKDPAHPDYPEVRPVRSFNYPEGGTFEYVSTPRDVCFVTTKKRVGILPEILEALLSERKRVKKMRKKFAENSMDYAVLDGRQLALKVCANSVYGFTGAGKGYLGEKRIASSVTRVGRGMANHTKFMCEDKYKEHGLQIVYGDSVIGSTPLMLRINGKIVVRRIETLAIKWSSYHNGKESCELTGVESWTENGWTSVKRVIRHTCDKKLVQVHTHTGNVVCTTDHSLVRTSGEEVAPKDLSTGDSLLHHCPIEFPEHNHTWTVCFDRVLIGPNGHTYKSLKEAAADLLVHVGTVTRKCTWSHTPQTICYTPQFAQLLGMFVGDGSCGNYNAKSGKKSSWAINNANKEMLEKYKTIVQNIFPNFEWKILPTLKSSGVYKLVPSSSKYGNIARFVGFWRKICYNDKREKKIHDCVLQSSEKHRQYFWKGLHDADGTKKGSPEISQKGTQISLSIVLLLRSLGWKHVVVDARQDKPNIFRMRARHKTRKSPTRVRKITDWNRVETFVYDLTTENHHFHAGVGTMIVHNTDSVFANIPPSMCDTNCPREELIAKVDKIGDEMGKFCTQAFLPPNDLEYEKFYYPILLKGKKRYAGHKFEPGLKPKLDVKGFECVRRDFAPIVSKTQKEILIKLCKENDIQGAINYARSVVIKLLENNVSIEELTMSKQLTRRPEDYKNPAPHTELAKYLQETQPAHIAPKTGDRIDYLIRPGFKGEKNCMRAVTPESVRNGEAIADTKWYLTNQLEKPLRRIFEMVMENTDEIFRISSIKKSSVSSNPMMRSFVNLTSRAQKTRKDKSKQVVFKKKERTKKIVSIASFFK